MATTLKTPPTNSEQPPTETPRLGSLDWPTLLPYIGALILFAVLIQPMVVAWLFEYNKPGSYYAHAPLIPFIIILMFWARRETLRAVPKAPAPIAALVLVPALALFVFASKSFALSLTSMAFLLIVWSGAWLALGTRFIRAFWVPLVFLSLMVPLPAPVLNDATLKLQMTSTLFADKLLHLMMFHTVLHGNIIQMDNFPLFVDVPCSGFKTLVSMLTFSAAFAYLVDGTRAKRVLLFLLSAPLALVINSVRIALIGVVGECINDHAAHVFHDWSGIFTLILGFTVLFSIAKAFGCRTFAGWAIF